MQEKEDRESLGRAEEKVERELSAAKNSTTEQYKDALESLLAKAEKIMAQDENTNFMASKLAEENIIPEDLIRSSIESSPSEKEAIASMAKFTDSLMALGAEEELITKIMQQMAGKEMSELDAEMKAMFKDAITEKVKKAAQKRVQELVFKIEKFMKKGVLEKIKTAEKFFGAEKLSLLPKEAGLFIVELIEQKPPPTPEECVYIAKMILQMFGYKDKYFVFAQVNDPNVAPNTIEFDLAFMKRFKPELFEKCKGALLAAHLKFAEVREKDDAPEAFGVKYKFLSDRLAALPTEVKTPEGTVIDDPMYDIRTKSVETGEVIDKVPDHLKTPEEVLEWAGKQVWKDEKHRKKILDKWSIENKQDPRMMWEMTNDTVVKKVIEQFTKPEQDKLLKIIKELVSNENPPTVIGSELSIDEATKLRRQYKDNLTLQKRLSEYIYASYATNLLDHSKGAEDYYENFYDPTYKRIQAEVNSEASYAALPDDDPGKQAEISKRYMQTVFKTLEYINIKLFTNVIEQGGEPTENGIMEASNQLNPSIGYYNTNPSNMYRSIGAVLTRLKTTADTIVRNNDPRFNNINLAVVKRDIKEYTDPIELRTRKIANSRIYYGQDNISRHTSAIEEYFETHFTALDSSYRMRALVRRRDGKFLDHLKTDTFKPFITSKLYDEILASPSGELISSLTGYIESSMRMHFADKGWINDQALQAFLFSPKESFYSLMYDFVNDNFPDTPEWEKRSALYMAIGIVYARFKYHLLVSKARPSRAFSGTEEHRINALFRYDTNSWQFATFDDNFGQLATHEEYWKGGKFLPINDSTRKIESIDHTVPVGAFIHASSVDYGFFFRNIDEHFSDWDKAGGRNPLGALPKSLDRFNEFNMGEMGSYDALRWWRAKAGTAGNISTKYVKYDHASDNFRINPSHPEAYTVVWKSLENMGVNALYSMLVEETKFSVKDGKVKNEKQLEHLYKFLFDKYFTQPDSYGYHMIRRNTAFTRDDLTSKDAFWAKMKQRMLDEGAGGEVVTIANDVFYDALTAVIAEHSPLDLLTMETPFESQTGASSTLIGQIKDLYRKDKDGYYGEEIIRNEDGQEVKTVNTDKWRETIGDLHYVQTMARQAVTQQVNVNRDRWEAAGGANGINRNLYGADMLGSLHSDVEIVTGSGERGYRITPNVVKTILCRKYDISIDRFNSIDIKQALATPESGRTPEMISAIKITKALQLHADIYKFSVVGDRDDRIEGLDDVATPQLPSYAEAKAFLEKNLAVTFKKGSGLNPDEQAKKVKEIVEQGLGRNEEEYKQKHQRDLMSRASWFRLMWQKKFFGVTFMSDANDQWYQFSNADEDLVQRAADMVQESTVKYKGIFTDPDNKNGYVETAKSFAKDPRKTIEAMGDFINAEFKLQGRNLGPDAAGEFKERYIVNVLDQVCKEDKYRYSMWQEVKAFLFNYNKMSLASDRGQFNVGRSPGAMEMRGLLKHMRVKKLISPDLEKQFQERYKAQFADIFKEVSPRVAILMFVLFMFANAAFIKKGYEEQFTGAK